MRELVRRGSSSLRLLQRAVAAQDSLLVAAKAALDATYDAARPRDDGARYEVDFTGATLGFTLGLVGRNALKVRNVRRTCPHADALRGRRCRPLSRAAGGRAPRRSAAWAATTWCAAAGSQGG